MRHFMLNAQSAFFSVKYSNALLTSADAVVVPQHGAVLDGPELVEHVLDLLLPELLAHHAHEDLPL